MIDPLWNFDIFSGVGAGISCLQFLNHANKLKHKTHLTWQVPGKFKKLAIQAELTQSSESQHQGRRSRITTTRTKQVHSFGCQQLKDSSLRECVAGAPILTEIDPHRCEE